MARGLLLGWSMTTTATDSERATTAALLLSARYGALRGSERALRCAARAQTWAAGHRAALLAAEVMRLAGLRGALL